MLAVSRPNANRPYPYRHSWASLLGARVPVPQPILHSIVVHMGFCADEPSTLCNQNVIHTEDSAGAVEGGNGLGGWRCWMNLLWYRASCCKPRAPSHNCLENELESFDGSDLPIVCQNKIAFLLWTCVQQS